MSRLPILTVLLGLFVAGCGSDTPTTPGTTAPPNRFVFTSTISAANEIPAITNAESGARGQVTVVFNVTRDGAGAITGSTEDVTATFTGFPNGSALTAAHIHTGGATATGGVVVPLLPTAGEVTFPNGNGSFVHTGFGPPSTIDIVNQIIANPSAFYFNVHTTLNPGGVARGQLALSQ
jgi:hypothetical protein